MSDVFPRTGGRLRRRIDLRRWDAHTATGWIEDDFHHFGVTVAHRDGMITNVTAEAVRAPWSTCPAAGIPLRALIGQPLITRASDVGTLIDMRIQCTHMFDLAGLVLAHAAHGRDRRRYEAIVPDRELVGRDGRQFTFAEARVTLACDGVDVLAWDVAQPMIVSPPAFAGRSLEEGFRAWIETLPEDIAEYAFILRRAVMVASGRMIDLDRFDFAGEGEMPAVCHTYQPGTRNVARRNRGATRNFENDGEDMLAAADRQARPIEAEIN